MLLNLFFLFLFFVKFHLFRFSFVTNFLSPKTKSTRELTSHRTCDQSTKLVYVSNTTEEGCCIIINTIMKVGRLNTAVSSNSKSRRKAAAAAVHTECTPKWKSQYQKQPQAKYNNSCTFSSAQNKTK